MNNFEKIIGDDSIKTELLQVCDMIKNREIYDKLGAKLPCGVLLYGNPGLGKSLMAKCFIKECNLKSFTLRKSKSENFVEYITETFNKAKENAPSIVFLDDMDKFANEDDSHSDAEEYVAVQAGIDSIKDFDVFVIATVNDMRKLPDSLTRAGRFDKNIEFYQPYYEDSLRIIEHYLENKNTSEYLLPEIDNIQIKRWRSFRRHKAQLEQNCAMLDFDCRIKQRQALLQWAYNPMF